MSTSRLVTVFFANPVIRQVARMPLPSTRQAMMRVRSATLKLFILTTMPGKSQVSTKTTQA